jgi:hypothetical protein
VIVIVLALLILMPNAAIAGGRSGVARSHGSVVRARPHAVVAAPSVFPTTVDPWRFWGVSTFPRRVFPRHAFPFAGSVPLIGGGVYASTVYAAAPPTAYASGDPIASVSALPSAPPVPALIEYPTGWYQLRGDGVSAPYAWVWIPKPPAPPVEVAGPPQPPAPPSEAPASRAARGQLFRWVDEQDVIHWTDRLERVPQRYRAKVEQVS